jgi:hypothetical protein
MTTATRRVAVVFFTSRSFSPQQDAAIRTGDAGGSPIILPPARAQPTSVPTHRPAFSRHVAQVLVLMRDLAETIVSALAGATADARRQIEVFRVLVVAVAVA